MLNLVQLVLGLATVLAAASFAGTLGRRPATSVAAASRLLGVPVRTLADECQRTTGNR